MQVQYVNDILPRSDNKSGKPAGITLFNIYTVVDIQKDQYLILNDENKLSRYGKRRFLISDDESVKPLTETYNALTRPMRLEINRLRKLTIELLKNQQQN